MVIDPPTHRRHTAVAAPFAGPAKLTNVINNGRSERDTPCISR
jgi:hypothetical protein